MKTVLIAASALTLAACSSNPKLEGFDKVEYIQRQEVIHASKECVNARMKPNIQYAKDTVIFRQIQNVDKHETYSWVSLSLRFGYGVEGRGIIYSRR